MRRLALASVLASLVCFTASEATEVSFYPGGRPVANMEVSRPTTRDGSSAPVEIQLSIGGVDVKRQADGFHTVHVEGLTPLGELGAPDLSSTGVLLALPPGVEPRLEILSTQERTLESVPVGACQQKARCKIPKEQVRFYFDSDLYDSIRVFPANTIQFEELGRMQGIRLVRVAIYPLQMVMHKSSLKVTTSLKARIRFLGVALPTKFSPSFATLARQMAANGDDDIFAPVDEPQTLLIFTADSLEKEIAPLVEWKRQKGLKVEVFNFTTLGGTREKAKSFLKNYYSKAKRKPSYLLIVGNSKTFPGFSEKTTNGDAATDYTYTILDGKDDIPDILHGRLLADSAAEARSQVQKWIAYEKADSGDWYQNATTIASDEGADPSDEDYANTINSSLKTHSFRSVDSFFQGKGNATPSKIQAALAEGRSWIAYFGHGTGTDWASTNGPGGMFGLSDVKNVDNASKLPFIVDVACQNGSWVDLNPCFGKAWIAKERNGKPAGAVAYYGGSVNVSWHEPAVMSVGVAKYHFERAVESVGASVFAGQIYLLEKMGIASNTVENMKWFNLFGDPSLLLRTLAPRTYSLSQSVTTTGSDTEFTVVATDSSGAPVEGVNTALMAPSETQAMAVGYTDPAGKAVMRVKGRTIPAGTVLTGSGYNLATYQIAAKR